MTTGPLRDGRWLRLDGAVNVRDLGGLPTLDGGRTRHGVAFRADNLQDLTADDVAALVEALGVRTVIDLRTAAETRHAGLGPLHAAGLAHRHLSLVPDAGLLLPTATEDGDDAAAAAAASAAEDVRVLPDRAGTTPVDVYLGYLGEAPEAVVEAVRILADPASGPVVFHCAAGKDRTGVLAALVESAVGVTREAVLADYLATAERVPAILDRLRQSAAYARDLADTALSAHLPRAETLAAVLDALDAQWGGAPGWLLAHGLAAEHLDALRGRLVGD